MPLPLAFRASPLVVPLLLAACTGELTGTPTNANRPADAGMPDDPDVAPEQRTAEAVCRAWREGHVERAQGPASGVDVGTCAAGAMSDDALEDATRRVNLFRWLNGLPPAALNDDADTLAAQQECALMMVANRALSHDPPNTWACFTAGGARAAAESNLSFGRSTAAAAIDGFMVDSGANNARVGHRRWFLSDALATVSFGAAYGNGTASCAHVFDQSGEGSDRGFTAFPNPGVSPIEQLADFGGLAATRWSVHATFFRTGDRVRMFRTDDGAELDVKPDPGNGGAFFDGSPGSIGRAEALVWLPDGWTPEAGTRYEVVVERDGAGGAERRLVYETELVSCE